MNYITKVPISKGWSSDKKYCVTDENGTRYLLRVSDIAQHDTKQSEFNMMKQVAFLGVPMCQPIEFGTCEDGVYSIQSWIDGEDAEQVMSSYSDTEQYVYGLEAGRILRKIHSIPAPATQEDWEIRFNRKMDYKIKKYGECPIKYENGQAFIDYINENRHLLKNRPQVYQHGDYHIGNMMIDHTCFDTSKYAGYFFTPLDFVSSPNSMWYDDVKHGIEQTFDYWLDNINEQGVWNPNFSWGIDSDVSRQVTENWKGYITVKRAKILLNFGRIEK